MLHKNKIQTSFVNRSISTRQNCVLTAELAKGFGRKYPLGQSKKLIFVLVASGAIELKVQNQGVGVRQIDLAFCWGPRSLLEESAPGNAESRPQNGDCLVRGCFNSWRSETMLSHAVSCQSADCNRTGNQLLTFTGEQSCLGSILCQNAHCL